MSATKIIVDKDGVEHIQPDWPTRHKFIETMLKVCGDIKPPTTTATDAVTDWAEIIREARERVNADLRSRIVVQHTDAEYIDVRP